MTNALFRDSYDMEDLFLMVCEGVADKRIDRAMQVLRSRLSDEDISQLRRQLDDGDAAHAERFRSFDDAKRLVYHWKDEFPSPKNKFIQGIVRMQIDMAERGQTDQTMAAAQTARFQQALKLLCTAHSEEYDENLNGLSMEQIVSKFRDEAKQSTARDREAVAAMRFAGKSPYRIVRITSFEEAQKYGDYTSWCITHYRNMWDSYSQSGLCPFYFCLREGFENEREVPGDNAPLDSYGLSMIAVCVNIDGSLKTCTVRWNHGEGGNDQILDAARLSQIVGLNFYETFKPLSKDEMRDMLRSGGWRYVGTPRYENFGIYLYKNDHGDGLRLNSDFEQVHVLYDQWDNIAKAENGRIIWNCGTPPSSVVSFAANHVSSLDGCPASVGSLEVYDCPELMSMKGAPAIVKDKGSGYTTLHIHDCPSLETLEGLNASEGQYAEHVVIAECPRLKSLDGLPSGLRCEKLTIMRLNISSLRGLQNVSPETQVHINHCDNLESLEGLPRKMWSMDIHYCRSLKSMNGAPETVLYNVTVAECPSLSSLSGFPNTSTESDIELRELRNLESLDGLQGKSCRELEIWNCDGLRSLLGCPKRVERDFVVRECGIESLEGGPEFVGEYYIVNRCKSLSTTKGIAQTIGGPLSLTNNDNLVVLSGIRRPFLSPQKAGGTLLEVNRCPNLSRIEDTDGIPVLDASLDDASRDIMIRNGILLDGEKGNPVKITTFNGYQWNLIKAKTGSRY